MKIKKSYQYLIIGGIAVVLLYLYLHKRAILSARELNRPAGGGGGSQLSEGMMFQQTLTKCLMMGGTHEQCGQMILPL